MNTIDWIEAAMENDMDGLTNGIKFIFNCRDAEIADARRIWIGSPMRGHWLDQDDLDHVARALAAGDI
jgi:hypothetical protein